MAINIGRRQFVVGLGGTAVAGPLAARAQQPPHKIPIVGVLWHDASAEAEEVYLSVLRAAFKDLGYTEGKNIILEHRFPAEKPDRFRAFAQELVASKVDAIIAVTSVGAIEAKRATSTIPIVFVLVADPVGKGLVESLARPGGNATGLSLMTNDLSGKRLGLLKEAVPSLSRVAILVDPRDPFAQDAIKAYQAAAKALGISVWPIEVTTPEDIDPAFSKIAQDHADGVILGAGAITFDQRARIGSAALTHKLPTLGFIAEMVPYGLLLSYGQDVPDYFRSAVTYTDKILKGAKPGDIPVEQPTKFELVLNLKTAKALGLTVPNPLIVSADEVIE